MKTVVVGLFAQVDAGKTSLIEALLTKTGEKNKFGRVDKGESLLDFIPEERKRGITIFAKEAHFSYEDTDFILLDTPGHPDFQKERRAVYPVLDIAVLVISATEKNKERPALIYRELQSQGIPVLVFINKMDIAYQTQPELLKEIIPALKGPLIAANDLDEQIALLNEVSLEHYLREGALPSGERSAVLQQGIYHPVLFGSATKQQGIEELLSFLSQSSKTPCGADNLLLYLYKVHHEKGQAFSHLKILSGNIRLKDTIYHAQIQEIRCYQGAKYTRKATATAGQLVAVRGIENPPIGTYYPSKATIAPQPKYFFWNITADGNPLSLYGKCKELSLEMPDFQVTFDGVDQEVKAALQGELLFEVVTHLMMERYQTFIRFGETKIVYYESISEESYGFCHLENGKDRVEITLKLSPSSSLNIHNHSGNSPGDALAESVRRTPLQGLYTTNGFKNCEISILTLELSSPKIPLSFISGAFYRSFYHALTKTATIFLEPHYPFSLKKDDTFPEIRDILNSLSVSFEENEEQLRAYANASQIREIQKSPLHFLNFSDDPEVLLPRAVLPFPERRNIYCESVIHKKGKLETISSQQIDEYFAPSYLANKESPLHTLQKIDEKELMRVWNHTYKQKDRTFVKDPKKESENERINTFRNKTNKFVIDGYNLLYAMEDLSFIAKSDLFSARIKLIERIGDMQAYFDVPFLLVFDAYQQDSVKERKDIRGNIEIVYTKKEQSADLYIQTLIKENSDYRYIVVSSDALIQLAVLKDAFRLSSREFITRYHRLQKEVQLPDSKKIKPLQSLRKLLEEE